MLGISDRKVSRALAGEALRAYRAPPDDRFAERHENDGLGLLTIHAGPQGERRLRRARQPLGVAVCPSPHELYVQATLRTAEDVVWLAQLIATYRWPAPSARLSEAIFVTARPDPTEVTVRATMRRREDGLILLNRIGRYL